MLWKREYRRGSEDELALLPMLDRLLITVRDTGLCVIDLRSDIGLETLGQSEYGYPPDTRIRVLSSHIRLRASSSYTMDMIVGRY